MHYEYNLKWEREREIMIGKIVKIKSDHLIKKEND